VNSQDQTFIQTYTGRFYYNPIRIDHICGLDIAHALAHLCRFNGQCRTFYSVAQHCCLVADYLHSQTSDLDVVRWGLLHDAAEAYIGDMPSPLKAFVPQFQSMENNILDAIAKRFSLPQPMPEEVKEVDKRIVVDEASVLFSPKPVWTTYAQSLGVHIVPWGVEASKRNFGFYMERLELRPFV